MRSHLVTKIGVIPAMALIPVGSQAITFNLNDITPGDINAAALHAISPRKQTINPRLLSAPVNRQSKYDGFTFECPWLRFSHFPKSLRVTRRSMARVIKRLTPMTITLISLPQRSKSTRPAKPTP